MLSKIGLYIRTVKHLSISQIISRVRRMVNVNTVLPEFNGGKTIIHGSLERVAAVPELDFDSTFLSRFNCDEILSNKLTLLHYSEEVDWQNSWLECHNTHLWSFNLHYQEYLLALLKKSIDCNKVAYVDKAFEIIRSWINNCPLSPKADSWHPYTISIRSANWLAFISEGAEYITSNKPIVAVMETSLIEQYKWLCSHLETDLLANHYFENLKAIILLAVFFNDKDTLDKVLPLFEEQINIQILDDGMHFELSPMYHKVVLEGLLRVIAALQNIGKSNEKLENTAKKMCDALYSLEVGINRTPLFNDSGDNVAKSRDALLACCERLLNYRPVVSRDLKNAGYFFIERNCSIGEVKLIFDAGIPGPAYASGHSHCDALSFELYVNGEPAIVNLGTYAYQDNKRGFFRSSTAHNGVWREGIEQSEMWGTHRMARASSSRIIERTNGEDQTKLTAEMTDYRGGVIVREISLDWDYLNISDEILQGKGALVSALHFPSKTGKPYAPDFGKIDSATQFVLESSSGKHSICIPLNALVDEKLIISVFS